MNSFAPYSTAVLNIELLAKVTFQWYIICDYKIWKKKTLKDVLKSVLTFIFIRLHYMLNKGKTSTPHFYLGMACSVTICHFGQVIDHFLGKRL